MYGTSFIQIKNKEFTERNRITISMSWPWDAFSQTKPKYLREETKKAVP